MTARIFNQKYLLFLFLGCVLSRIASSIFYIEDIDSLRFALSIEEYNIIKLQPHFPGYPIFCFLAKFLFFFTNSKAISFSIIGGFSLFIIIYFTLKLFQIRNNTFKGLCCSALIFFNPFLWLMSNRYMPDLMGLAVAMASLYFLIIKMKENKYTLLGFVLFGILAGIRLSYTPLLLLPIFYHLLQNSKKSHLLFSFIIGCSIWLIPMIFITGLNSLYEAALKHTSGHFSDFGGTFITENLWGKRIINLISSVWADGLGGYWYGRSWQTLLLSLPMVYFLYNGIYEIKDKKLSKENLLIIGAIIVYLIWILFFQNIIYKSRHIMPLLIFIIIILNTGINSTVYDKGLFRSIVLGCFFLSLINITAVLIGQHKNPSAISNLKDNIAKNHDGQIIISNNLINYYLKAHGIKKDFINIDDKEDIEMLKKNKFDSLYLIGNYSKIFVDDYKIYLDSNYYHNPYVNKMWSEISAYRLIHKTDVQKN